MARLYTVLILLVMSLYLILNYGFMQLRIPPLASGGVPVGEVVLLFSLALINYSKLLPALASTVLLVPFLVWWVLGIGRAVASVPEHGWWALRDATHVIESLFLIIGFAFAASPRAVERFFSWLPRILTVGCVYAIGYMFQTSLQSLSPQVVGAAGHGVPMFFNYSNTGAILIMGAAYLVLFRRSASISDTLAVVMAALILSYSALILQARTVYLQIFAVILLFAVYRRDLLGRGYVVALLMIAALLLLPLLEETQIMGRLGQTVSVEFLANHIMTIFGIESPGLEGSAYGVEQRLGWWTNLYERWTENIQTFLFGLGYGIPLVDFVYGVSGMEQGVPIREPHNSYVSILARIGLVGGLAFVWMHALMLRTWQRSYNACTGMDLNKERNRLLILMVYFVMVWVWSIGEDALEKPYITIPYYFFWGVVLQMSRQLQHATTTAVPEESPHVRSELAARGS